MILKAKHITNKKKSIIKIKINILGLNIDYLMKQIFKYIFNLLILL